MKGYDVYSKIQQLREAGLSQRQTAQQLGIHRKTVKRYWKIKAEAYEARRKGSRRMQQLDEYRERIIGWLREYPTLTAAQVSDWLKEHYQTDFKDRTVSRYVKRLREEYGLKKAVHRREYEAAPELPMGQQLQVDFGQMTLRNAAQGHTKVYVAAFFLARSRYRYAYLQSRPFTSADLVRACHDCFAYMGGVPEEMVFDQDSILCVSENAGDIIFTYEFEKFRQESKAAIYLCRKADPESKGKVENVVKYVKRNFLAGRTFNSLEVLNTEVLQWLEKTGNGKIHGTTRLVPAEEFEIERKYLLPYYGEPVPPKDEPKEYHVRKDNTVRYRTNYYSVPSGTYRNLNTVVWLLENNGHIELYDKESGKLICRHELCPGKGKNVCDKRHHKDKTRSVNDLQVRIRKRTEDDPTVILWLRNLEREKPRYYRDNMKLLLHVISEYGKETVIAALRTCLEKNIYNSLSVQEISGSIHRSKDNMNGMTFQAPTSIPETADCHPEKTDINQYNKFFE